MAGRLSPAIQRLLQKLASDPTSKAFVPLAELYIQCDLMVEAIDVLSEGIQRYPAYVAARMMRGKLHLQAKRIQEAKEDFEVVIETHPEHIQAYKYLAHLHREMGNLNEAMTLYKRILDVDPRDPTAAHLLSSVREEMATLNELHALSKSLPQQDEPASGSDPAIVSEFHKPPHKESTPASEGEEGVIPMDYSNNAHNEAACTPTLFSPTRLQTWLASIQERRKKYELS